MEKEKFLRFPLNIQLFAESEPSGNIETTQKTEEEFVSKIDFEKLKAQFDKTSSELAKYKKEAKDRLTEDEKKAQEQAEKDQRLAELEQKVLTSDMSNELLSSGLEKDSISKIIETYKKGDMVNLCKTISEEIKKLTDKITKELNQKFQQSQSIPPVGSDGKTTIDPYVVDYLKSKEKNKSNNDARKYYGIND